MIREQISNMCAREVGAKDVKISYYVDPVYGASFIFQDDGCGMDYTGDLEKPGRLDRFLNMGFSEIVGFKGDEFSWKGLGSKLALNCRRIELETWTRDGNGCRVEVDEPYKTLTKIPPEVPKAEIYKLPQENFKRSGTLLKVLGYEGGKTGRDYSFRNIKNYLLHRSLLGCTRPRDFPRAELKVLDQSEVLPLGYPFIKKPSENEWWTVAIDPPIEKNEKCGDGTEVKVILKGGFTEETSKYNMTPKNRNIGMILSVRGIPYFELDFYEFRGNLNPMRTLCNMIVECDELFEIMDLARGDYRREDEKAGAFERALKEAIRELISRSEYKLYLEKGRMEEEKRRGQILQERKNALMSSGQKYVRVEGVDDIVHREPENENDVLALLSKLEGMKKLPFAQFRTLEHTSTRKGGIDMIAHFKEDEASELKAFTSIELETEFESFERHKHYPGQTNYVFCWKVSDPDILQKARERYKYFKKIGDFMIEVFEISQFPGIFCKTKS